jgi:rod shape-determining protein MreD
VNPTLWQRMDVVARRLVPIGLTLVLILFAQTPTHVPGLTHTTPMYDLAAVYFWSIYRPDLMGYGAGFGLGLLEDLLTGAPLGTDSLTLLACQYVVFHQQKFFNAKPFGVMWAAFAVLALGAGLLKWLVIGIVSTSFTRFGDMVMSVLMTVAIYPIIAWLLAKAQMKLLVQP